MAVSLNDLLWESPQQHFMIPLLEVQREMDLLAQQEIHVLNQDIKDQLDRVRALNSERVEQINQLSKEISSRSTWNRVQTIAQYISSFGTFALGFSLGLASGAGRAFVLGGGIGLANRLLADAGMYRTIASYYTSSEALQKKIERRADLALSWASTLITVSVSAYTVYNWYLDTPCVAESIRKTASQILKVHPMDLNDGLVQKVLTALSTLGSVVQHGAGLIKNIDDRNIARLNASLEISQAEVILTKDGAHHSAKEIELWVKDSNKINDIVKQGII